MIHKSVVFLRLLSLALFATMSVSIMSLQIQSVEARPITMIVSPRSAAVGETVTVSGANATEGGEVSLYLSGSLFLATTTANSTGGYSVSLAVPSVPHNTYSIRAVDLTTGDNASAPFAVEPRITLSPEEGSFDNRVIVKGDGFMFYSNITIWLDLIDVTPLLTPRTDFRGMFEAGIRVPLIPNGTYTITVIDLLGNTGEAQFDVVPKITLEPFAAARSAIVFVDGYGFAPAMEVRIRFGTIDVTPFPGVITSMQGSFFAPFFVPDVPNGAYTINASDLEGNVATAQFLVPSPVLTATPDSISEPSIVTVKGMGFQPDNPVVLSLDGVPMTNLVDLMLASENLMPNDSGFFEYSFVVPLTEPGIYSISASQSVGLYPTELTKLAYVSLTITENNPIDVQVNVGSMHFRGEIAEFYARTALGGKLVNASIDKALLYYANGSTYQDLSGSVEPIASGLFRIPFAIPNTTPFGTYVLLVEANYGADFSEVAGVSSSSFVLSPTLTAQNAQLVSIDNSIGTIVIPDLGTIKANLRAINATLINIEGNIATIRSDIGTLKTSSDTINARLTAIEGDEAVIQSDIGSLKTNMAAVHAKVTSVDGNVATISSDLGTITSQIGTSPQTNTAAMILSLIAAIGAVLTVLIVRKKTPNTTNPTMPTQPPPPTDPTASKQEPLSETQEEKSATPQTESPPQKEPQPTESHPQAESPPVESPPPAQSEPITAIVIPPETLLITEPQQTTSRPEEPSQQ